MLLSVGSSAIRRPSVEVRLAGDVDKRTVGNIVLASTAARAVKSACGMTPSEAEPPMRQMAASMVLMFFWSPLAPQTGVQA